NVWSAIKAVYSSFVAQSQAWEIGESFFNSLSRRVFSTEGVDQAIEFVDSEFDAPPTSSPLDVRRIYSGAALPELISAALTDPEAGGFAAECWNELGVPVRLAAERVEAKFPGTGQSVSKVRLEMINRAFYRGGAPTLSVARFAMVAMMSRCLWPFVCAMKMNAASRSMPCSS